MILAKLQPIQISDAYAKLLAAGRRDGKGGLSARTVHHCHRVLNSALDAPATIEVIEAARDRRLFVPILLGSLSGIRRGEITALRWKSVDIDRGQLAVIASTEQTKAGTREKDSKSSKCRTIALPALLVDELRRHRLAQAEELLRIGVRVTGETHVVTQADGQPLQPNSLTHAVTLFMKEHGSKVRLHGLRHSHASHLLASKVHPKIVQERFGHSSIAITMDIYSHLMPNMQTDAAAKVDDAMQDALRKRAR